MYTGFERFTTAELVNMVLNNGVAHSPMTYELARRLDAESWRQEMTRRAMQVVTRTP